MLRSIPGNQSPNSLSVCSSFAPAASSPLQADPQVHLSRRLDATQRATAIPLFATLFHDTFEPMLKYTVLLLMTFCSVCSGQEIDRFGGNKAIKSKATGFFRVEEFNGRWLFVTPEGHGYVALGANHVGKYLDLQADEMGLLDRFGGDRALAAEYLIDQMKQMGLTAGEAYAPLAPELKPVLPWVANLRFPAKSKFAFDVFDPEFQKKLHESVIKQCAELRDDPMVLGIAFADLPVWDHRRVRFFEQLESSSPGGKELAGYRNAGKSDDEFLGHVADILYEQLAKACRRGAPNHLFFGERHRLRGTPDEVLRSVGKHVDVFCTQALILSPQRPPEWQVFQAERYDYEQKLTGKPMLVIDWAAPFSLSHPLETEKGTLRAEQQAAEEAASWLIECMKRPYMIGVFKCQLIGLHGNDRWFEGRARRTYLKDNGESFDHRTSITQRAHQAALQQAYSAAQIEHPLPTVPNVLLIVADDLGFSDLGCYGGEIDTPNLDQLAKNGLRLTQFYTTGRCCPSRASLLTGRYPHSVGLGHMTKDIGQPGYRGQISADAQTIAQRLSGAGYRSFLSGKWHLGTNDPTRHGFEEFYGTLTSAKTFWDADHYLRLPQGRKPLPYKQGEFYGTNALADHAIEFLKQHRAKGNPKRERGKGVGTSALQRGIRADCKIPRSRFGLPDAEASNEPWFLYLAINAPHFPLQAPKSLIKKYADRYVEGWDVARDRRLARMKELGIVPDDVTLTPRSAYFDWGERAPADNPAWDTLDKERQADLARRMAIYAAMVDSMDQSVGRVLASLRAKGELENTLIVFTSDNGACAEWDHFGFDIKSSPHNKLHRDEELEQMGSPGTFHSAGSGWANVSNTPWRLYKHYNHEGGIAVPCIVHWPARLENDSSRRGDIDDTPSHLIDILPTIVDAAQLETRSVSERSEAREEPKPDKVPRLRVGLPTAASAGSHRYAVDGESLLPLLEGATVSDRQLFFEHEGNRAVREGQWKLVALRDQPWELYNMQTDRTELNNLVTKHPETVRRLSRAWDDWAAENNVTPLPSDYQVEYVPARGAQGAQSEILTSGPVRKLADGFRFTEGPAWDGDGNWYFSDIPNKTLHRISREGNPKRERGIIDEDAIPRSRFGLPKSIRTGEQASNGIVVGLDGHLIFCEVGGRRIVSRSVDGKETTLADSCDGNPIGMPNDLWLSPTGSVYFTIPRTNKRRAKVVPANAVNGTVCLIDANGESVRDVGIGLKSPNGIVGSSDGKYLYVADPGSQKCWRYSIAADGSLKDQRIAADQGSDGLALDERGNLYTTSKQGIDVYSPDAELISTIEVPEPPANMKFGGDDGRTLLITARTGIYAVKMHIRGDLTVEEQK